MGQFPQWNGSEAETSPKALAGTSPSATINKGSMAVKKASKQASRPGPSSSENASQSGPTFGRKPHQCSGAYPQVNVQRAVALHGSQLCRRERHRLPPQKKSGRSERLQGGEASSCATFEPRKAPHTVSVLAPKGLGPAKAARNCQRYRPEEYRTVGVGEKIGPTAAILTLGNLALP